MLRVSVLILLAGGMLCLAEGGKAPDPSTGATGAKAEPASQPGKVKKADNSYCLVCHANYEEEKLSAKHAKAGVGCEKCHGKSSKHSSDEDGLTPPQIMYPREKIVAACLACHKAEKIKDEDDHKKVFDKSGAVLANAKTCTECHGKHKMKVRTRIWDKNTGKLLSDDGVRMMGKKAPQTQPADKK